MAVMEEREDKDLPKNKDANGDFPRQSAFFATPTVLILDVETAVILAYMQIILSCFFSLLIMRYFST